MRVSIILPVCNVEKYIEKCLDSILGQTLSDFEIIAVDDASTDNSLSILWKYAHKDNRITIVEHKENLGTMVARESGCKKASGDYLVFIDSDDMLPTNALHDLFHAAVTENADLVIGNYIYIDKHGKSCTCQQPLRYGLDANAVFKSLFRNEIKHALWGKMYKTRFLRGNKFDIFKYQFKANDAILFYQIVNMNPKIVKIESNTYIYSYRENSVDNILCSPILMDNLIFSHQYRFYLLDKRIKLKRLQQRYFLRFFLDLKYRGYKNSFIFPSLRKYKIHHMVLWATISHIYTFPISVMVWIAANYISNTLFLRFFLVFLRRIK